MPLQVEIITAERLIFADDNVDEVVAPGAVGQLGILPRHAALISALDYGELRVKKGNDETVMAIGGGFLEVLADRVLVLADAAERVEEIDIERAEAARRRAQERLQGQVETEEELAAVQAALLRSLTRIKIAERRRRRSG